MRHKIISLIGVPLLSLSFLILFSPNYSYAATPPNCNGVSKCENCNGNSGGFLGIPTWYKYLEPQYTPAQASHPGDSTANPPVPATPGYAESCRVHFPKNEKGKEDVTLAIGPILLAVTEILLRLGTYLAVAIIIWGGFQYQLSQGDPERTKNARTMILNSLIGLVIAISATAIVNLVGRNIF
ncbi:MAG: pilin [Patescibacteria group bacterium]